MPILSIDLASGDYADVGVVAVTRDAEGVLFVPVDLPEVGLRGKPQAGELARFLVELAGELGATATGLDGPQGWKSATNGLEHSRVCEARLATQGKTGLPGVTKPGNYLGFISFCIDTFDEMARLGWHRFAGQAGAAQVAAETFPTAAWRALGLKALPGKSKSRGAEVEEWTRLLVGGGFGRLAGPLTHDQLQAAVSGLGILALAEGNEAGYEAIGDPPFQGDGHWLEGYIVNPRRDAKSPPRAWP